MQVKNPVLRGFNPDPSILHVDGNYYIATSTFEWFPGICINHSKDLANWEIAGYALTDDNILDMTGFDMSCGIWAPNLTYSSGLFYLVYTVVYTDRQRYKDTYNYLVTAGDVKGPWSRPVFLNCSGFDPSLFHEGEKKYLVNMVIDHRVNHERFAGVDVQEYDVKAEKLIGQPVRISAGTSRPDTEGPNIIKKDGYYYLTLAEGGTLYNHCTTALRSRNLFGPYEENPNNPVLTSVGQEGCLLQRAGHSQIMQGGDGRWYMAHLASRPIAQCSILGRESSIQNIEWTSDGWFKLSANQTGKPEITFSVPAEVKQKRDSSEFVDFRDGIIPLSYMSLRRSFKTNGIELVNQKLRISGGASIMGKFRQGLIARRQQSFECDFTAAMQFRPRHLNHIAGLLVYYNYDNNYYLKMSRDENGEFLCVSSTVNRKLNDSDPVYLPSAAPQTIYLKVKIRKEDLIFSYSVNGMEFISLGTVLDMKNISDERIEGNGFTGSMLGVNCCDVQGDGVYADFLSFDYREYGPEQEDDASRR